MIEFECRSSQGGQPLTKLTIPSCCSESAARDAFWALSKRGEVDTRDLRGPVSVTVWWDEEPSNRNPVGGRDSKNFRFDASPSNRPPWV
jgi:hypothetical protein